MTDITNPQSSILDSDLYDVYDNFIKENYEQLQLLGAIYSMDPAAAASFYDDFIHPPPPASELIPETQIQEAITSILLPSVEYLTINSILDTVKQIESVSELADDIIQYHVNDYLSIGVSDGDITMLGGDKCTLSYTFRVTTALEELTNTNSDGTSAEEVITKITGKVTIGRVSKNRIIGALFQGTKAGRYICKNNLYKIQPQYVIATPDEKKQIMATKKKVKKRLAKSVPKNKRDEKWNNMFAELEEYKSKHGNCNVPQKIPKLGSWVNNIRQEYKKKEHGYLTTDRIQKLQSIGFAFNRNDEHWNNMFAELKAYKDEKGNMNVPQKYDDNPKFGNWVHKQRQEYKKKEHGQLTDYRIQKLRSIGFAFNQLDQQWNDMVAKLKDYESEHGDCNVPQRYDADPSLGTWVMDVRSGYKGKPGGHKMNDERIKQLEEIGFDWVWKRPSYKWVVSVLKKFYEKHGHCHTPYPTSTKSQTLKKVWPFVVRLRKQVRQGKEIPAWLLDELKKVEFELDPPNRRDRRNRVETLIFYDLETNHKIKFNGWDEKIENTDARPDAFIVWKYEGKFYIIFKEIDEHRHDDRSIVYEQTRMTMLTALAKELGFDGIYFVRTNSAERKDIDPIQQAGVAKLIWSIKDKPQDGVHVRYVDFPFNHHHYVASVARWIDEDDDEVDLATGEEGEHFMLSLFNSVDEFNTCCEAGM